MQPGLWPANPVPTIFVMNHIYRLIWNHHTNAWVCCAETARGRGKLGSGRSSRSGRARKPIPDAARTRPLRGVVNGVVSGVVSGITNGAAVLGLSALSALYAPWALAAPSGAQVTVGSGNIAQSGAVTTITQGSQNLAINWQSFNIASNETVNFVQPNAAAVALNRVVGQDPSQILGSLHANGQVFILNPNGVLFGAGAQVSVGGLVAATQNLSDADFAAGNYQFTGAANGSASVVNQGTLTASNGGYIALLAPTVRNSGTMTANQGMALLAAGNQITLQLDKGSLLGYSISQGALQALVDNQQAIIADGGQVVLTAQALDALHSAVVNNSGVIEARTVANVGGVIRLLGDMHSGSVTVDGTLDASAPNGGNGGFIETSAAQVSVAPTAHITTQATGGVNGAQGVNGTWLIDPTDFTVAASGGDMTGATLSSNLGSGNVTIQSSSGASGTLGNVNINDTVTWSANTLTLNAQNNININNAMNGSGSATLALQYGQGAVAAGNTSTYNVNAAVNLAAGNHFSTKLGSNGTVNQFTVITSLGAAGSTTGTDLQGMRGSLSTNYALGANIDATATSGWNSNAGFTPISTFTATFDGLGHTINNLSITSTSGNVGLFGNTSAASVVQNVGLTNVNISGDGYTGALIGTSLGPVSNSYSSGSVTSSGAIVGGLVGAMIGTVASISNSHSSATVTSSANAIGGLLGLSNSASESITNSYATGAVNGTSAVGGLVGEGLAPISNSYASGAVSGYSSIGGLIGYSLAGNVANSYATGAVNVSGTYGGGLIGQINAGTISNSYASGGVTGSGTYQGGLVGYYSGGAFTNCVWNSSINSAASGNSTLSGTNVGMTLAAMQVQANYNSATTANGNVNLGWDFANTWAIAPGQTPALRALFTPLTITVNSVSTTYNDQAYTLTPSVTYSITPNASLISGTLTYSGAGTTGTDINAGSYAIVASGLTSSSYLITYVNGALTINPAPLTVSTSNVSKTYNGTTTAAGSAVVTNGTLYGSNTLSGGTFAFSTKDVGSGNKTVTVSGVTVNDGVSGADYTVSYANNTTSTITPAALTISTGNVSKVYDSTTSASGSAMVTGGTLYGSDTLSGGTFAFNNKNVGSGNKTVTVSGVTVNDGVSGADYTVSYANNTTSTITPATLTFNASALNKVYDGTTTASGALVPIVFGSDVVTVTTTGQVFASKNVSPSQTVNISGISLGGADAANYSVGGGGTATATAAITPLTLTFDASALSKVYDGSTSASGTLTTNALAADGLTITETGAVFASKNASPTQTVNISGIAVSGVNASNYSYGTTATATAAITPKALTVSGITAANKPYDGTTSATVSTTNVVGNGLVPGDNLTVSVTGAFSDPTVGNNKTVLLSSTYGGADAQNYSITSQASTSANITASANGSQVASVINSISLTPGGAGGGGAGGGGAGFGALGGLGGSGTDGANGGGIASNNAAGSGAAGNGNGAAGNGNGGAGFGGLGGSETDGANSGGFASNNTAGSGAAGAGSAGNSGADNAGTGNAGLGGSGTDSFGSSSMALGYSNNGDFASTDSLGNRSTSGSTNSGSSNSGSSNSGSSNSGSSNSGAGNTASGNTSADGSATNSNASASNTTATQPTAALRQDNQSITRFGILSVRNGGVRPPTDPLRISAR